jgi:hypothetical protein
MADGQPNEAGPMLEAWLVSARSCRVLPADPAAAERALRFLETTPRSIVGSLMVRTGGLVIDGGWLRVLGSGCSAMPGGIVEWNRPTEHVEALEGGLIVAHDAIGGFFAINLGGMHGGAGYVHYLAPDTLEWQDLGLGHSAWLQWMLSADLSGFYERFRWPGWEVNMGQLAPEQGVSVWPPLFVPGPAVGDRSRRVISQRELWAVLSPLRRQVAPAPSALDLAA